MASAEGGSLAVPSGVGHGEGRGGCPLSSRLVGINGFWRILKAAERSFLSLYDEI